MDKPSGEEVTNPKPLTAKLGDLLRSQTLGTGTHALFDTRENWDNGPGSFPAPEDFKESNDRSSENTNPYQFRSAKRAP